MENEDGPILQNGSYQLQSPSSSVMPKGDERGTGQVVVDALGDDEGVAPCFQYVGRQEFRMSAVDAFMDPDEVLPHGAPSVKRNVIQK
ncbi:hypothetical protein INF26_02790 [Olsenella sp. DSM 107455]|uniref:Uncharacterized protein n=1 Tax=Thermophilibacter gallinarum TaxID=2779357 RepID=A0ABR9QRR9_9ACTN|nr:hypothetical protein [Thermophilibacter gallinarum]MBE5023782.1 hypothetical protein [Thermophilibacter gallinarum]